MKNIAVSSTHVCIIIIANAMLEYKRRLGYEHFKLQAAVVVVLYRITAVMKSNVEDEEDKKAREVVRVSNQSIAVTQSTAFN